MTLWQMEHGRHEGTQQKKGKKKAWKMEAKQSDGTGETYVGCQYSLVGKKGDAVHGCRQDPENVGDSWSGRVQAGHENM